jgi:HEAT repeat protein
MAHLPQVFRPARRRTAWLLLGLIVVACPSRGMAQEPVQELKQILLTKPPLDPMEAKLFNAEREQKLLRIIDTRLRSLSELRQAMMLKEWGDVVTKLDPESLEANLRDARARARIAKLYRSKVRGLTVVQKGSDDSKAAIANLITELGLTVRAVTDPEKLAKMVKLARLEKPAPADEAELVRLASELENDRRTGFARSLTDELMRLADSNSEFVRLHALRALGGSNPDPKRAAAVFAARLTTSNDVHDRRVAADGLLRLISIASYLKDLKLKSLAVWAEDIDVLNADFEVVRVAPLGLGDPDAEVRARCADAIRVCAQVFAVFFQRQLEESKNIGILTPRSPAEVEAMKAVLKAFQEAGPRLAGALEDPDVDVRLFVVQALERLSDARYRLAEEPINVAAVPNKIRLVPPEAADPLRNFAEGDWRAVSRLLTDPDARVRRGAVNFFEFFPEARPSVVPELGRALCDPDRFVRWGAARGLGNFSKNYGPRQAVGVVPSLGKVLFDADFAVRIAAAATLEALGEFAEGAVPELGRAIHFGDVDNRIACLYVVQSIGPERTRSLVPSVTEALAYQDPRVRRVAAETLGKFGPLARNPGTVAALRRALGDDDQEVRINASEAILQILDSE